MNAREHSLAELWWAAEGAGFMASFGAAVIVAHMPFTATVIDPEAINPFGEKKRLSPDAQRLREWQANRRWALTFGKPKKR